MHRRRTTCVSVICFHQASSLMGEISMSGDMPSGSLKGRPTDGPPNGLWPPAGLMELPNGLWLPRGAFAALPNGLGFASDVFMLVLMGVGSARVTRQHLSLK